MVEKRPPEKGGKPTFKDVTGKLGANGRRRIVKAARGILQKVVEDKAATRPPKQTPEDEGGGEKSADGA